MTKQISRVIKFRAWSKNDKSMGAPFDLYNELIIKGYGPNETGWLNDTIFMQFTGLLDKNGKEVFEGDIITDLEDHQEPRNYIVGFEAGGFWLLNRDNNEFGWCESDNMEVIGNIYENGDLL